MSSNQRYFLTGLFVLITLTVAVFGAIWFSAANREEFNIYLTQFHEATEGVTIGSSVRYYGVVVGNVKSVELNPDDPRIVDVLLNIYAKIKINASTYAQIKSQGITGMSYIDLALTNNANPSIQLLPHNSPPYPLITTKKSLLSKLSDNAQLVTGNVEKITDKINDAFNPYNIEHLSNILANLDKLSKTIANRSKSIDKSIASVEGILNTVNNEAKKVDGVLKNTNALSKNLMKTSSGVSNMVSSINTSTLPNINNVLIPNLNQSFVNLKRITDELNDFLEMLNQNPAILIRGRSVGSPGPGE